MASLSLSLFFRPPQSQRSTAIRHATLRSSQPTNNNNKKNGRPVRVEEVEQELENRPNRRRRRRRVALKKKRVSRGSGPTTAPHPT